MAVCPRYHIRKARSGWYILGTRAGAPVRVGLTQPGTRQLADRLNRTA